MNAHIRSGFRFLVRNKTYVGLNILGLSVGMAVSLLIFLWIHTELKMDGFHENKDRLYKLYRYEDVLNGDDIIGDNQSALLVPALLNEVPGIEAATRIPYNNRLLIKSGDKWFFERGIYADSSFFKMFSFPFVMGDAQTALIDLSSVVISEKLARKCFGEENPLGKTIQAKMLKDEVFTVTGVFKDITDESSLQFDYVFSIEKFLKDQPWNLGWGQLNLESYALIQAGVSVDTVNLRIRDFYKKYHKEWSSNVDVFMAPFHKDRIYPLYYKGGEKKGSIALLNTMTLVGLLILFLACFNYLNLSTALSGQRVNEVAQKKIVGSGSWRLRIQFLTESMMVTFLSILLAVMIAELSLSSFKNILMKPIHIDYQSYMFWILITGIFIVSTLLSGLYPAVFLSSYKPLTIVKGGSSGKAGKAWFRKGLVVLQFAIASFLIVMMVVIQKQVNYVRNKDLGLDIENIIGFNTYKNINEHRQAFREDIEKIQGVSSISFSSHNPLQVGSSTTDPAWEGKQPDDNRWFFVLQTDYDYLNTFGIKIKEGRDFSTSFPSDTNNFLINEKAAKAMGMQDPVGQKLSMWGRSGQIIGVVEDFVFSHLANDITQLVIILWPESTWQVFIRLEAGMADKAIPEIRKVFEKYEPEYPFEFKFQSDTFNDMYTSNLFMFGKISYAATFIAFLLSCLGLFGLSSFMARERSREIGIRKVLGASSFGVSQMLVTNYLFLVGIGFFIGALASWFLAKGFLQYFSNRIELNLVLLLWAAGVTFLLATLTVFWQSWRTAQINPSKTIRYE